MFPMRSLQKRWACRRRRSNALCTGYANAIAPCSAKKLLKPSKDRTRSMTNFLISVRRYGPQNRQDEFEVSAREIEIRTLTKLRIGHSHSAYESVLRLRDRASDV